MAIMDILSAAQGGRFFANAAQAAGLDENRTRKTIGQFAPAIATRLKDKAAADPHAFDSLLDLIEEGGDSSDLDDVEAITGAEAQSDGTAILGELYGSPAAAAKALGTASAADQRIASISATAVFAALAASHAATQSTGTPQAVAGESAGGGFLSIIIAALVKGLLQGASRQLAPRRRRRRRYTYSARRRSTRRRVRRPGLDDIFRDILTGRN